MSLVGLLASSFLFPLSPPEGLSLSLSLVSARGRKEGKSFESEEKGGGERGERHFCLLPERTENETQSSATSVGGRYWGGGLVRRP